MASIAVDARELAGRPTGVGRYLFELLERWRVAPHEFVPYSHEPLPPEAPFSDRAVILAGSGGTRWEQTVLAGALRRARHDVLFAPASTAPLLTSTPVVLTIHDLSFAAHPEWFEWREGVRRRIVTRLAARKATSILTDSAFSAAEIVERLGLPPSKLRVIYLGIPREADVVDKAQRIRPGAQDEREPMALFVGSIFNRRHVPDLVRAFERVLRSAPEARLVIVGENRTHPREDPAALARSLGIADRVELREYLPDPEVAALYAQAAVFVFVSEYEGFGLTPLEALARGTPIVVANTPLSREIYGDAALTVGVGDIGGLAEAIRTLIQHPIRRGALISRAPDVLARYSWDRAAAETLTAIEQVACR